MLASAAVVLGHGGKFTWDEGLMVLAPLLVFALLLSKANRRAKAIARAGRAEADAIVEGETDTAEASNAPTPPT